MALFGPKRRARPRPVAEEPVAPVVEPPRPPRTVGEILRAARRRQDGDIEEIAQRLRIRASFIEAIEEGRYDRLPGAAYALGFVRAYAEQLGLDGHEIARRFKAEAAGLERRQDLSLPMPLPERSRPGGAILLTALIVASCAYALWWYFASGERIRPERVAAPPVEIAPRPIPPVATAPSDPEPAVTSTPAPPAPTDTAPAPPPAAPGLTVSETPPTTPPAAPPATSPPATIAAAPTGQPVSPTAPPPPAGAAPVPPAPSAPPVASVLPPPPPPPLAEGAPTPDTPRVYGVTNGPARIVIRATADSWIQIRDRDGTQARILKPGELYRVPDRPGVTMRTGNAGGIEILVDGKTAPSIGQVGQPRNVLLDPDRLLAGTAVVSQATQ